MQYYADRSICGKRIEFNLLFFCMLQERSKWCHLTVIDIWFILMGPFLKSPEEFLPDVYNASHLTHAIEQVNMISR